MNPWLLVAGAYLVGSIPWSYLVVRIVKGTDVRREGSGNVGATNVMRTAGKRAGALALLLDIAKGVVAVLAARALVGEPRWIAAAAAAVVVGHVFPVFLGFRGGKGVATAAGALGTLAPWALLVSAAIFAVVVTTTRFVSLASICAVVALPTALWLGQRAGWPARAPEETVLAAALVAGLIVLKHRGNIRRLRAGTERRLGEPREAA